MTPDEIAILVAGLIGGSALLSLLVTLLVLTYAEQLRRIFHIQPLAPVPPALPRHYVLPYLQPGPLVEPVGTIHAPAPQRRNTYAARTSDDDLPPRNATPGPSNVPRTPPPAYNPEEEAQEYGRFLRAVFRSPTPDLPLITIPDSPEAPIRALLPEPDYEAPRPQTPFHRQPVLCPLPAGAITFDLPAHLCPLPDSDSESDSDASDYGGNEPVAEREEDDPLNPHGLDYEHGSFDASTSNKEAGSKDQKIGNGWGDTSPSQEDRRSLASEEMPPLPPVSTTIGSAPTIQPQPETEYGTYDPEPMRSRAPSQTSYWPSHLPRETAPIWTAPPDFDHFNQDYETFGGWADEEEEMDTAFDYEGYQGYTPTPLNQGDYRGYTSAPHFYQQPFPLPDSPTYAAPNYPPPTHPRRIQQY
ncbi:uncharacterized protein ARMOST_04635 [Armillaria ostoyae]|uniref:Uncharacterized protein n=1 Tax=Armillaria ostoyae TaxID=47428 RepID=A0A284QY33_ARMOS|nr:uncharacterized protein ARMOST_04635 [Armillaria ostoyae]